MTARRPSRVRAELELWRISWQQVETFLDRVDGAREEDLPYAVRCGALYDAAIVLERLRLRREGTWMPHPLRMGLGGNPATIATAHAARKYDLPGPLEVEMAVAGLDVDGDGKPRKSPPKVRLFGSEDIFEIWSAEEKRFVPLVAPEYAFGRLLYPPGAAVHPWIPGLKVQAIATPELGEGASSDDCLFSFPRRQAAAEEGFAALKPWSALRALRLQAIAADGVKEQVAAGQPEFAELRQRISSGSYAQARSLIDAARSRASTDASTLAAGRAALEAADPDDEAIAPLTALADLIASERSLLTSLRTTLEGSVTASERAAALSLVDRLPTPLAATPIAAALYAQLDAAIAERIAYPDGPLRSLRTLEVAMVKMWRARAPWFAQRRAVLARLLGRFVLGFERNLTALVQASTTHLAQAVVGARVTTATAANADHLALDRAASAVATVRPGEIAVIGGARPSLAVILGPGTPLRGGQRLRTLPLRVSQARGLGLDGIPGLIDAGALLGRTLAPPLTGDELRRGRRAGEPEADAIAQDVVALWSRLRLLRGADFALALPAPFDAALSLPVHVTAETPLPARTGRLILPTAPIDASADPPQPLVATPGELLLLRGRDGEGLWWQGAVEVAAAEVTTLEAENLAPERDPASPLCCEPHTPVVLVTLAGNTMPVELVDHVSAHRGFRGFGWPSLAVGKLLPQSIDARTELIAAEPLGAGFRFVVGGNGPLVDRTPELEAAARLLDRWTGGMG